MEPPLICWFMFTHLAIPIYIYYLYIIMWYTWHKLSLSLSIYLHIYIHIHTTDHKLHDIHRSHSTVVKHQLAIVWGPHMIFPSGARMWSCWMVWPDKRFTMEWQSNHTWCKRWSGADKEPDWCSKPKNLLGINHQNNHQKLGFKHDIIINLSSTQAFWCLFSQQPTTRRVCAML